MTTVFATISIFTGLFVGLFRDLARPTSIHLLCLGSSLFLFFQISLAYSATSQSLEQSRVSWACVGLHHREFAAFRLFWVHFDVFRYILIGIDSSAWISVNISLNRLSRHASVHLGMPRSILAYLGPSQCVRVHELHFLLFAIFSRQPLF